MKETVQKACIMRLVNAARANGGEVGNTRIKGPWICWVPSRMVSGSGIAIVGYGGAWKGIYGGHAWSAAVGTRTATAYPVRVKCIRFGVSQGVSS